MSTSGEQREPQGDGDNPDPRVATPDENFSYNVKFLREKLDLSQEAVAEKMRECGYPFHQATIYKIENGSRKVSIAEAKALATILDGELERMLDVPRDYIEVWYIRNRIKEFDGSVGILYDAITAYRDACVELLYQIEERPELFRKASGGAHSIKWWRSRVKRSATAIVEEAELSGYILGDLGDMAVGELSLDQQIQVARWELDRATLVEESASERLGLAALNLKRLEATQYLHECRELILDTLKKAGSAEQKMDDISFKLDLIREECGVWVHLQNLLRLLDEVPDVDWEQAGMRIQDLLKDPELNPQEQG